jgi:hypothetical protein
MLPQVDNVIQKKIKKKMQQYTSTGDALIIEASIQSGPCQIGAEVHREDLI